MIVIVLVGVLSHLFKESKPQQALREVLLADEQLLYQVASFRRTQDGGCGHRILLLVLLLNNIIIVLLLRLLILLLIMIYTNNNTTTTNTTTIFTSITTSNTDYYCL